MIEQKLRQQRVVANRELLSKFQLPGNIFSASALIFERTLKVLVGASLLSHHEKTLDGILEKFINGDASILKNKSAIFQRVANYDGSENVQFSDNTVSSLDELQRYMTATKPNLNMLLVAIAKLGEARAALGAGNVVPRVDSAVRLESIVRAQEELRRRVDQMRRDFASQIDDLRGQMDMGIAKILFAIQGGAGKLHEGLKYE